VKIRHELARAPHDERELVLAIGFFDGLHLGHREIVKALLRLRKPGQRAAVLTFRNHPSTYLRPDRTPPLISTLEERVNLLAATGIDELYLVPFDERIAALEARVFLQDILLGGLRIRALVPHWQLRRCGPAPWTFAPYRRYWMRANACRARACARRSPPATSQSPIGSWVSPGRWPGAWS